MSGIKSLIGIFRVNQLILLENFHGIYSFSTLQVAKRKSNILHFRLILSVMMLMRCFWFPLLLFTFSSSGEFNGDAKGVTYLITTFQRSNGIYYEYQSPMKRTTSTWRMAIFLDLQKLDKFLSTCKIHLETLHHQCSPKYSTECYYIIQDNNLNDKMTIAEKLRQDILPEQEELEMRSKENVYSKMPRGMRTRRATPMLGILGGLIGPIAGLLTYEDGETIESQIGELNAAQANISHLVGKQTHVIRAELEEIHHQTMIHEQEIREHKNQLTEIMRAAEQLKTQLSKFNYTAPIQRVLRTMEMGLDHYIRSADRLLEAIRFARRKQLHPSLLTTRQLEPIFRDIQDHEPELSFPISGPKVSVEELTQVATTTIICEKGKLKVIMDIPLVERKSYTIYKMYPLPVPQPILQNGTGRAYIFSEFSHIAVDAQQRTYSLMKIENINSCRRLSDCYLCSSNSPVFEIADHKSCEGRLLLNPTIDVLKTCNIKITYQDQPYWVNLQTLGGWLFSLSRKTPAKLRCPSKPDENIQLLGTGILQLAPGCGLRMADMTLPAIPVVRGTTEAIYEPDLHLNLSELSSILASADQLTAVTGQFQETMAGPLLIDGNFQRNSQTLGELEQRFFEISLQRQLRAKQTKLIHGSYAGIGILTITLLIFFWHTKILSGIIFLRQCLRCKRKTTLGIDPEVHFVPRDEPTAVLSQGEAEPSMSLHAESTPTKQPNIPMRMIATPRSPIQLPKQTLLPP